MTRCCFVGWFRGAVEVVGREVIKGVKGVKGVKGDPKLFLGRL